MKRHMIVAVVALSLGVGALVPMDCLAQRVAKKKAGTTLHATYRLLPRSLDALYPPASGQPVLLMKMLELNTHLTGIVVDLFENDLENARANFGKFESVYAETQRLVPEWTDDFPRKPVNDLGRALSSGDQGKTMGAVKTIGMGCDGCHQQTMANVQQKYHWPDIRSIIVTDPLTKADVEFPEFKEYLNAAFTGIAVDAGQGQGDNARRQFQGFRARFQTLSETCETCHDTERKYYVDAHVRALIDDLGKALDSSEINLKEVGELSEKIGTESCFKCHLVHAPAALAKARWEKEEKR
jgi:hypothetical protein